VNDQAGQRRTEPEKLHRPWRSLVAAIEVVVAGLAVWAAFPVWQHGVRTLTQVLSDGTVLVSTRYVGSWMAGAIGLAMVAAILLVDVVRELVLAGRVRTSRHRGRRSGTKGGTKGGADGGTEGSIEGSLADLNGS
jgi:hypothetical protein